LTDKQISTLNERIDEFQAAKDKVRNKIVSNFLDSFEDVLPLDANFDILTVGIISALLAALGYSHRFLAHLPAPLSWWQG